MTMENENRNDLQTIYDLLWKVRRRSGLTKDRIVESEMEKKQLSSQAIRAILKLAQSLGSEIEDKQFDNTDEYGNILS